MTKQASFSVYTAAMSDWGNMKGRKNRKKQTASMSEPIDLEAGGHTGEPVASDIVKSSIDAAHTIGVPPTTGASTVQDVANTTDVAAPEPLRATEDSITAVIKGLPKTAKAPIPPPPKRKTTNEETTTKTIKGNTPAAPKTSDLVESGLYKADTINDRTKGETSKEAPELTKAINSTTHKTKATNKKVKKETVQSVNPAPESRALDVPEPPVPETVQVTGIGELSVNPSVATWSFAPDLPKVGDEKVSGLVMTKSHQDVKAKGDVVRSSLVAQNQSGDPPANEPLRLPPLPPFDHYAFSRINNAPQRTTK